MRRKVKLVSVIIPIYKVEKYLGQCFESVRSQTYKNLEIILVDDGSPDKCGEMCEQYKKEDSRVKVVHKKNEGLGYARNSGMEIATGDYVMFVDSDDWLETDAVASMVEQAELHTADMIICGFKKYIDESHIINMNKVQKTEIYIGFDEIFKKGICPIIGAEATKGKSDEREMCVWTNLYSMDIIRQNGISFVSEREFLTEDFFFNIQYMLNAKKIVMLPRQFYFYRYNAISLSNEYRENKISLLQNMTETAIEFFDSHDLSRKIGFRLHRAYFKRLRHCLMQVSAAKITSKEKNDKFAEALRNSITRKLVSDYPIKSVPLKEGIMIWFIRLQWKKALKLYLDIQRGLIYMRGYRN